MSAFRGPGQPLGTRPMSRSSLSRLALRGLFAGLAAGAAATLLLGTTAGAQSIAGFDFNRRVIVLSGGVALRRGSDTLNGGRLTIDLNSGLASVDGRGSAPGSTTGSNGRVSGTFSVPGGN